jgi:hypothetical protein
MEHAPNMWDVENQIEPENVIFIDAKRIPAEEFVTADDIANVPRVTGWRLLLAWFGFIGGSALVWYALGWAAVHGAERVMR